ncbi:hypothetical protein EVAR_38435_1 [Eumeta japonica]|uniref:Uncharacterized protein n=1 Tax=Eumeta variegata TaxID=151549 RepID=A0A4C1WWM1_EUMVA|nr:hypothetical protein EVAR_38435_1 [Eumeta japonica]
MFTYCLRGEQTSLSFYEISTFKSGVELGNYTEHRVRNCVDKKVLITPGALTQCSLMRGPRLPAAAGPAAPRRRLNLTVLNAVFRLLCIDFVLINDPA